MNRFIEEIIQLGIKSIFIVVLMSAFMGAVIVIQTATAIDSAWIPDYTAYKGKTQAKGGGGKESQSQGKGAVIGEPMHPGGAKGSAKGTMERRRMCPRGAGKKGTANTNAYSAQTGTFVKNAATKGTITECVRHLPTSANIHR